ncbi:MAG: glycoside hydrolase family 2 TIM barrel-domain containing protein [Flavobacterium sp.]|uniref:glycoside hydrolase family 2 protein n=1 Tax=Flavobacterium sp. TaxID=239 RepID=UPI002734CEF0|nr:sugar-binding domain-containing protein [Flavobacterium sp.]MDP3681816.1 glycoside hydrolase family 2 TIM barrel-domain containing protein [Flavobacterium sp.]MDZ4330860.1 glycoside hydrolase family 2 TIM barrel-domain containing protein [Flavobacterium sp.]
MKKNVTVLLFLCLGLSLSAQWKPAGEKIKTEWANEVNPKLVLPEYPRPIMERKEWKNLNGLWNYAIQEVGKSAPAKYDGQILVPFAVESSLSGVMKEVGAKNELWYNTTFNIESNWKGQNILLHFGAVDWKTEVWLNGVKIGSHTGGYTPFSFDITPFITGTTQQLTVKVWDPSNEGTQPRGKQVKNPEGIWYTPVTGIWQTVWIEPVNKKNITTLKTTPNIDQNVISIKPEVAGASYGDLIEVTVYDDSKTIATGKASVGENLEIVLNNPKLWSPESPFLYKTNVKLISNGKVVDQVKSYFAMRKIGSKRDANGVLRMQLNNKDYFQFGPLDQGWWPDGLYTAPTDEALKYDIVKTKELGFNMIRKHVKVEPERWYTHCDELGILVWQDMPSGDEQPIWQDKKYFEGTELQRTPKSEEIYKKEWKAIMDHLYSYPSIVVWVPFNEAWGQFKTVEITEWTKNHDPSRLVNSSSGGNHFQTGDILDLHKYPGPELYLYDARRITVLGEYGGIGLPLEGHLWKANDNWGYIKFKNATEVTNEYIKYAKELKKLVKNGFSAAVYTQTTDVEGEVNGFMTYDRKVDKMDFEKVRTINKEVIDALNH